MSIEKEKIVIGRAENIRLPEIGEVATHARIDSGARTSAIWGDASINADGNLEVTFFGDETNRHVFSEYGRIAVATSTGHIDKRYTIRLLVAIKGRRIRATFTIANRQTQVYPVLIGRNVLRGKFVVDVKLGKVLKSAEKKRIESLRAELGVEGENS